MRGIRQFVAAAALAALAWSGTRGSAAAQLESPEPREVLQGWYQLVLELVRHTPTYSPPVASRSFAYMGVAVFEAVASGSDDLTSLAGQLHGLTPVPPREAGKAYDDGVIVQAVMALSAQNLFSHTGPTGQR